MPRMSVGVLGLLGASLVVVAAQTPTPQSPADRDAAAQAAANAAVPRVALEPGLTPVPDYNQFNGDPPPVNVPEGFTPIFNGRNLDGWHISKVARHGYTPDFRVVHGVIVGTQQPWGHGGLLITDKKYRNFELSLEVKPDWGCDSGIFFRTTQTGIAYQITMDYLGNGNGGLARMIAEGGISLGGNRGGGAARGAGAGRAAALARRRTPRHRRLSHPVLPRSPGNARPGTSFACASRVMRQSSRCGSTASS